MTCPKCRGEMYEIGVVVPKSPGIVHLYQDHFACDCGFEETVDDIHGRALEDERMNKELWEAGSKWENI